MILSQSDLNTLRDEALGFMPETATVLRLTETPDGAGGWTDEETLVGTYSASIAPGGWRASEVARGMQEVSGSLWNISLPYGSDVEAQDTIHIGDRTLRAILVGERTWEITRRVLAEEVV